MLPLSGAKLLQLKNTSEVFLHICKTGAWQFIQFFWNKKIASCCWHLFFPTSCLDRNWVKQNLERFCLKESINLVELLGLIPSSPSSLQRFQTQQIDPFKTGQTPVLEFLGEQLLHDAEKNLRRGLFSTFTTDSPVPWSHLPWSHPLQLLKRWSL